MCTLEDILVFFTGTSSVPPLGFDRRPSVVFLHDPTAILPTASTCAHGTCTEIKRWFRWSLMHTGNAILVYFSDGSYFCISSASDDQLSVHNLVLCLHVHLCMYTYLRVSNTTIVVVVVSYPDSAKSSRAWVWDEKLLYSIDMSESHSP